MKSLLKPQHNEVWTCLHSPYHLVCFISTQAFCMNHLAIRSLSMDDKCPCLPGREFQASGWKCSGCSGWAQPKQTWVTKRHSAHATEMNLPYLDFHSWHRFQTHPRNPQHCPRWAPWKGTHRRACQASVLWRSPLHRLPGHLSGWGWGTSWDLMLVGLYRQGKGVMY